MSDPTESCGNFSSIALNKVITSSVLGSGKDDIVRVELAVARFGFGFGHCRLSQVREEIYVLEGNLAMAC
jgi:hypothetical protein